MVSAAYEVIGRAFSEHESSGGTSGKEIYEIALLGYILIAMTPVKDSEAAIRALPALEREKLVAELPSILPELNGDLEWDRIVNNSRPRPALSALGDEIEKRLTENPESFPEIKKGKFLQGS